MKTSKKETKGKAIIRYGEHQVMNEEVFKEVEEPFELVRDCAILSSNIYSSKVFNKKVVNKIEEQIVDYKISGNWKLLTDETMMDSAFAQLKSVPPKCTIIVGGLLYQVWVNKVDFKESLGIVAVLVFCGTDFKSFGDWFSNFNPLTKFIPCTWNQYKETRHLAPKIIALLQKEYPGVKKIIAVGHSLGGGLAQHAGYSNKDINIVYAFDPSPVTGFYDIEKIEREGNSEDLKILKIYEHGEILAYMRLVLRPFNPISYIKPKIIEIRFNFNDQAPPGVRQHGMEILAGGLKKLFENLKINKKTL